MSRYEEVSHHATTTSQAHVPLCPHCPWLGQDREGARYAAYTLQRAAQEALVAHLAEEHPTARTTPPGWESGQWDPARLHGLTVPRDLHGLLVVTGDTVTTLADDADPTVLDRLTPVERAVLAARLRSWADTLTNPEPTP